ncbi:unnamed protein product, partial [marine sediment metagenome]
MLTIEQRLDKKLNITSEIELRLDEKLGLRREPTPMNEIDIKSALDISQEFGIPTYISTRYYNDLVADPKDLPEVAEIREMKWETLPPAALSQKVKEWFIGKPEQR